MAVARSTALDALRGAAALGVFVFHAWLYTMARPDASARSTPGDFALHELRLGLVLFFVLSGFLLYAPWAAGRAPGLAAYARRRAARILPAYYVALAGSVVLLWPLAGEPGVRLPAAEDLPLFAVFAQNYGRDTVMRLDPPMWTLAVEVSFYAVLPLLGALALLLPAGRRAQSLLPLALLAAGVAFNWWLSVERPGVVHAKTLPAMLPYFALGMLAAVLAHARAPGRRTRAAMLAGGAALVAADALWHVLRDAAGAPVEPAMIVRDVPAAAGFALVVVAAATATGTVRGPTRALAALGTVSYGFYLWHVPVLLFLRAHGLLPLSTPGAALVGGAASLVVAAASWRLVERPAIAWARRSRRVRERRWVIRQPRPGRHTP
ncbi:MAG TPA: acyltransferase [Solirubrobacteraceae bacterium]|nr:acyltransferase [Solirubrobacteraceae bacterium]